MNRGTAADRAHPYPRHFASAFRQWYQYYVAVEFNPMQSHVTVRIPRIGVAPIRGIPTIHKHLRSALLDKIWIRYVQITNIYVIRVYLMQILSDQADLGLV